MKQSRREFCNSTAALSAVINTDASFVFRQRSDSDDLWCNKLRGCVQNNLNEHDPATLDVSTLIDYWKEIMIDTIGLIVGGSIAMHPTSLSNFNWSQFLNI